MLISGGAAGGHQKYLPTAALRNDSVDQTLSTRLFRCLHNLHKAGFSCGEIGIRTRDTILSYTRFPGVPLKPLEHLSNQFCISSMMIYVNEGANIGIIFRISFLLGKILHFR